MAAKSLSSIFLHHDRNQDNNAERDILIVSSYRHKIKAIGDDTKQQNSLQGSPRPSSPSDEWSSTNNRGRNRLQFQAGTNIRLRSVEDATQCKCSNPGDYTGQGININLGAFDRDTRQIACLFIASDRVRCST